MTPARHGRLRRRLAAFALCAGAIAAPGVSAACSVCMSGREDENQLAFILTTIFMSALPLALIGGVIVVLRRRFRDQERREAEPVRPARASDSSAAWVAPIRSA